MHRVLAHTALALLLVTFLAVNVFADRALTSARLDLTENKLYTLSEASKRIAKSPPEPVMLTYYFSQSQLAEQPQLLSEGRRAEELLEAFVAASDGKIILETIDPEPFSDEEDEAARLGLQPINLPTGAAYLGIVGTNLVETPPQVIAQIPDERFREVEIARVISTLANPDKPKIGLATQLDLGGRRDPQTGQITPPWSIVPQVATAFDVQPIPATWAKIPDDFDAVLLIHPRDLPPQTLYALDQYVLAGGRLIVFQDPYSIFDPGNDVSGAAVAPRPERTSSDLGPLLAAWGLDMRDGRVAADRTRAITRPIQTRAGVQNVPFPHFLDLSEAEIEEDDVAAGRFSRLTAYAAGVLDTLDDATTTITPIVTTSAEGGTLPVEPIRNLTDPTSLLPAIVPEGELTIAARISGPASTAFPDGPPEIPDELPIEAGQEPNAETQLTESTEAGINVIVVADADMLQDDLWLTRLGGSQLITADNGSLLLNLLDQLAGSPDLIDLRARADYARPFTKLEEIQRDADTELLERNQTLQEREDQIVTRINEILTGTGSDAARQREALLSQEVQQELATLRLEREETRKELRDNRLELSREIDAIKTRVQLINTAAVPVLLCVMALGLSIYRGARRREDRRRASRE